MMICRLAYSRMLELLPAPGRVLDIGCGSGRLTVELERRGWQAVGIDTHAGRLDQARARSSEVEWRLEDMDSPLRFRDGELDAVVSRCSMMIGADPVATLREVRRVLRPGGVVLTAIWAEPGQNRWFAEPRAAVADALGDAQAQFARAFGRLGSGDELLEVHRAAGFGNARVEAVVEPVEPESAEAHWAAVTNYIGHFHRLDAELSVEQRAAVIAALEPRLTPPWVRTLLVAHATGE